MKVISSNVGGAFDMPMMLAVIAVVSLVGISMLFASIVWFEEESERQNFASQIDDIVSTCEEMYEFSSSGSLIKKELSVPKSIDYVVFGSTPSKNSIGNLSWDINSSDSYGYVFESGQVFVSHATCQFCEMIGECAVFESGDFVICLELVFVDGESYVKVYED